MNTKEEVLQKCTVEGLTVKLPATQLDRKLYTDVSKSLELIGGKWKGGKISGFVFQSDPTELLVQIANGKKRNLKKEFQFFATPKELAIRLVELSFDHTRTTTGRILEPSAGQGSIIEAIHSGYDEYATVRYCEINQLNKSILEKIPRTEFIADDFLTINQPNRYATIIANPPFSNNQDIDHITKMYEVLKPGGRIVSISSKHWKQSEKKKETEFKNWLTTVNARYEDIPEKSFKDSGTNIAAIIIVIDKPE